jgi:hypothetical protein
MNYTQDRPDVVTDVSKDVSLTPRTYKSSIEIHAFKIEMVGFASALNHFRPSLFKNLFVEFSADVVYELLELN